MYAEVLCTFTWHHEVRKTKASSSHCSGLGTFEFTVLLTVTRDATALSGLRSLDTRCELSYKFKLQSCGRGAAHTPPAAMMVLCV